MKGAKVFRLLLILLFVAACAPSLSPADVALDPAFNYFLAREGDLVTVTLEGAPRQGVTLAVYTLGDLVTHPDAPMRRVEGAHVLSVGDVQRGYEVTVRAPERLSGATTQYDGNTLYRSECRAR